MRFLDMQSALDFVWANESLCPLEVLVDSGPLRTHDVFLQPPVPAACDNEDSQIAQDYQTDILSPVRDDRE